MFLSQCLRRVKGLSLLIGHLKHLFTYLLIATKVVRSPQTVQRRYLGRNRLPTFIVFDRAVAPRRRPDRPRLSPSSFGVLTASHSRLARAVSCRQAASLLLKLVAILTFAGRLSVCAYCLFSVLHSCFIFVTL